VTSGLLAWVAGRHGGGRGRSSTRSAGLRNTAGWRRDVRCRSHGGGARGVQVRASPLRGALGELMTAAGLVARIGTKLSSRSAQFDWAAR
jgi:hypothetical protein